MRGRKPTPTALKRPLNKGQPRSRHVFPRCPSFLDQEAKRKWNQFVRLLTSNSVVTEMDWTALATLCQVWSRWKFAEEHLQKFGAVIISPDKKFPMQSPYLAIANKCIEQMNRILAEFGMTPSSRSRIFDNDEQLSVEELAEKLAAFNAAVDELHRPPPEIMAAE